MLAEFTFELKSRFMGLLVLLVATSLFLSGLVSCQDCSAPVTPVLVNGKRTSCVPNPNGVGELSTFECDFGYEFTAHKNQKTIVTYNGVDNEILQCNPIGCKKAKIPTKEMAEKDKDSNTVFISSFCKQAPHPDHCMPEESFVDFVCKEGYKIDEQYGFLRLKCLNSYLWDTLPRCKTDKPGQNDDDEYYDYDEEPPKPPATPTPTQSTRTSTLAPLLNTSTTASLITTTTPITTLATTTSSTIASSSTSSTTTSATAGLTTLNVSNNSTSSSAATTLSTTASPSSLPFTNASQSSSTSASLSSTTLTSIPTTSNPIVISNFSCGQDRIPTPAFYNSDNITANLVNHPNFPNAYRVGSSVTYTCQLSYYVYNTEASSLSLTTTCLPNGTWSRVADCVKHPCWDKLPARPLNGRRDVRLVLGGLSGMTSGSHVNFTCNPYYERVGPPTVFCVNGQWEKNVPVCVPVKNVCQKRPWAAIPNGYLLSLFKEDVMQEQSLNQYKNATFYQAASYACFPGFRHDFRARTGIKFINGTAITFQNVTCIGEDDWGRSPECFRASK